MGQGTDRAGRDRVLAWAAGAWAVAALELGVEVPAGPERAVAQARACGNPAEGVAVRAAGDWEPAASELALAVAGEQEAAEEQAVPDLEAAGDWEAVASELALAAAVRARAVEAAQA